MTCCEDLEDVDLIVAYITEDNPARAAELLREYRRRGFFRGDGYATTAKYRRLMPVAEAKVHAIRKEQL